MTQSTYSDTNDKLMLSTGNALVEWAKFDAYILNKINQDKSIKRETILNAGAGRTVTDFEIPFFKSFEECFLVEPDDHRRKQLANNLCGLTAQVLSERIEQLSVNNNKSADFVLCKYVLQHVDTRKLDECFSSLKSIVRPGGRIGVFTAFSSEPNDFYQLLIDDDTQSAVPETLREVMKKGPRISEEMFNSLLSGENNFSFIATHYFSVNFLREKFQGWLISIVFGPYDVAYFEAIAP